MSESKPIDSFSGEYRYLSNYSLYSVNFNGITYPTSEHAFQAHKVNNPTIHKIFAKLETPREAKVLGRVINIRGDWNLIRDDIMFRIILDKFSQNWSIREKLIATGNVEIIEGNNWGDKYWGVCNGVGENKLGKILMRVRTQLL